MERIRRLLRLGLAICAWGYVLAIIGVLLTLRVQGDEWWLATVPLYGPRYLYIAPMAALAPWALFCDRRYLFLLVIPALLWAGPIMGFCIPWARFTAPAEPNAIRVMTCNLHGNCGDQDQLVRLAERDAVDIMVYQESGGDVKVPLDWHLEHRRSLAILSRWPIRNARWRWCLYPYDHWPPVDCLAVTIDTEYGPIDVVSVHFRTPRWGLEEVLDRNTIVDVSRSQRLTEEIHYRNHIAEAARDWISRHCKNPTVIGGDFNTVPDGCVYRRHWGDLQNAFSVAGLGCGYTRWAYVPVIGGRQPEEDQPAVGKPADAVHENRDELPDPKRMGVWYGARIDHLLCNEGLTAVDARVGPDVGSDHLPVIATFHVLPRENQDHLADALAQVGKCLFLRDCLVDGTFERLKDKPGLTTIAIENGTTTEAGIRALAALPDLENLYLETSVPVTAQQVRTLAEIPRLSNLALLGLREEGDLDALAAMNEVEAIVLSAPLDLLPGRTKDARTEHLVELFDGMESLTHVLLQPEWAPIVDETRLQEGLPGISLRVLAPINRFRFDRLYREPQYIQKETDAKRPFKR